VAGAGIRMGERHLAAEPGTQDRQGVAHIAEDQPLRGRHAIGMGRDGAFADIDLAPGEQRAQVVVGAAVAEAEFEHHPVESADQPGGMVEAGALRLEPADEAVEPAHDPAYWAAVAPAAPAPSRSWRTSDRAVRSWLLVESRRCASSRMIDTAIVGNSRTMRMNGSLEMRSATTRPLARTVALRGTSHRIAISATISFLPSVATVSGPAGPSSTIST